MTNAMKRVMVKTVAPAGGRTVESPRRALSSRQKLSTLRDRLVLARSRPPLLLRGKSLKKVDIIALADEDEDLIDATDPCNDTPNVADGTTMLLSATVIEFHDHYDYCESNSTYRTSKDKVDNKFDDDDGGGGGGDEPGSWDTFMAKLLRRIACCSPRDGSSVNEMIHEDGVTHNDNVDDRLATIELILRQSLCEGMDGFADPEPTSSPVVDTQQQSSTNDNDYFMMPSLDDWVHDPLLFVATSGTGMKVLGIRRVSEPSYHNSQDVHDVDKDRPVQQLPINNGKELPIDTRVIDFETNTFAGTALLRIRGSTGCSNESESNNRNTIINKYDYFAKQNRKFQMVISGRFKSNVIMANCMSGILLDHHLATASAPGSVDDVLDNMSNCAEGLPFLDESDGISKSSIQVTSNEMNDKRKRMVVRPLKKGKSISNNDNLPSKWALRAAVQVAGVFSPRMDADLECKHPRILSPLCSSAQTIIVSRNNTSGGGNSTRIEELLKEPPVSSDASLVKDISKFSTTNHNKHATTINHTQQRKSLFDDMYDAHTDSSSQSNNTSTVCFDPNAEYTFEFLQHLIDYNDLSLDLGKFIGKVKLSGGLRGQPARFVSVVKKRRHENPTPDNLDFLWSFDIWHKSCT